jgi:hypothetical protein
MSHEKSWASLRRELQAMMQTVGEELRAYPAPIPACDAQFNHLLELRRMLPQELARLDTMADDANLSVADFLRSSPCQASLAALLSDDTA